MDITVGGKRVFAATGGKDFDPALPCVIFLHGAGMDHTVWALQTRYFAWHGYGVLAVDLPGHGKSDGPALTSIGDMADWVWALCDALKVKAAALVGHSMGTLIALEAAARAPDRARGLGLVATGEKMPVHPDLQAAADAGEHKAYDLVVDWGFGKRGRLGGSKAPGLWMAGEATRLLERGADHALGKDFAACAAYEGALAAAAKVACPAVVIAGAGDKMTPPKSGRTVAEAIEGAAFVTIDCGHMHMIERPDETLDALRGTL
jgi:pimeloyl-ACP methyl ester carboxylesterase